MKRAKPRGIPAAMVLAGGISRHGSSCGCRFCTEESKPFTGSMRCASQILAGHCGGCAECRPDLWRGMP